MRFQACKRFVVLTILGALVFDAGLAMSDRRVYAFGSFGANIGPHSTGIPSTQTTVAIVNGVQVFKWVCGLNGVAGRPY